MVKRPQVRAFNEGAEAETWGLSGAVEKVLLHECDSEGSIPQLSNGFALLSLPSHFHRETLAARPFGVCCGMMFLLLIPCRHIGKMWEQHGTGT